MNIISGIFKNRIIKTSTKLSYRPTKSRVRKSLFDSLTQFQFNSVCDLFSGSGIIGFESASRGAESVTFVEKDHKALRLIKENAKLLKGPNYNFYGADVFSFIKHRNGYDFIYADPPYGEYDISLLAKEVLEHLNKKGKFFLECDKKQVPFFNCSVRDFGQTRILHWENT